MRKVLGITVVLAALAAAACGSAPEDNRTRPLVDSRPEPKQPEVRLDLDSLLLTRADLPDGYRRTDAPDEDEPMCEATESLDEVEADDEEAVAFLARKGAEVVVEKVQRYRGRRAEDAFDAIREEIRRCSRFTDEEDDGDRTIWEAEELELPDLGDERLGVRLVADESGSQVDALYVRYDRVVVGLGYVVTDPDDADRGLAERLLREIDDRVLSSGDGTSRD